MVYTYIHRERYNSNTGNVERWNSASKQWEVEGGGSGIDHGLLDGLTDDDHTQYALADGSRAFTGAVIIQAASGAAHLRYDLANDLDEFRIESADVGGGSVKLARGGRVNLVNQDQAYMGIAPNNTLYFSADGSHEILVNPDGSCKLDVTGFGLFGVMPVAQQAHIADPADLTQCEAAIASILDALEAYGLLATS